VDTCLAFNYRDEAGVVRKPYGYRQSVAGWTNTLYEYLGDLAPLSSFAQDYAVLRVDGTLPASIEGGSDFYLNQWLPTDFTKTYSTLGYGKVSEPEIEGNMYLTNPGGVIDQRGQIYIGNLEYFAGNSGGPVFQDGTINTVGIATGGINGGGSGVCAGVITPFTSQFFDFYGDVTHLLAPIN